MKYILKDIGKRITLYQVPKLFGLSIHIDWIEKPALLDIHILFWTIEIKLTKNKDEKDT